MSIDLALKKVNYDGDNFEHFLSAFATDLLLTQKIAYDGSNRAEYIGYAIPGTASSEAKWLIKKLTYSAAGVTDVQFAGGAAKFDQVWDNRAAASYS